MFAQTTFISYGLGSGGVDRQRKRIDRCENRTGIVHILKFYGFDQVVYIVLWREVGHVAVAQNRWPRVWRNLVSERYARQEVGNGHMNIDNHILNGGERSPGDDGREGALWWITIRIHANRDRSDNVANAVRYM